MEVNGTLLAFLALALAMGLRHGFDPDHIALIDGLTRYNSQERPRLAQRCGLLFTAGHIAVVLCVIVLIALAIKSWNPPAWLEVSGTLISISFLSAIGLVNLYAGLSSPRGAITSFVGIKSRLVGKVANGPGVFGIGMLFALSFDTVSQAGLMAITGAEHGVIGPVLAGIAFGVGMFGTAGLTSIWVARMNRRVDARAAAASRTMTVAIGCISLCIAALVAGSLMAEPVANWLEAYGLWISLGMTTLLASLFGACLLFLWPSSKIERTV